MKATTYYNLVQDAQEANNLEMFISERGWQDWMDEYGDDTDALASDMASIWNAVNMPMREFRGITKLSQVKFGIRFCIPRRTVEDWEAGISSPPVYLRLFMAESLGVLNIKHD